MHDLDLHVLFADLTKEYDNMNHEVEFVVLKNVGASQKNLKLTEKLHGDFDVVLKVGKEEEK